MSQASKIDEWWAANPAKHQQVAAVVLIIWLGGLGIGLIATGVDDATSIKHDLAFLTSYTNPQTLSNYHFKISTAEYQRYVAKDHNVATVPGYYAGFCDSTGLYPIAKLIKDSCGPFATDEMILQAVLSFVQDKSIPNSLKYMSDPVPGVEYPKYPLETLGDGGGDCEDSAILFASLAEVLGYDAILVFTIDHAFAAVHMNVPPVAVGSALKILIYEDRPYYPCECTGYGHYVGQMAAGITFADINGVLEAPLIDASSIDGIIWVLPIAAGAIVVVVVLVARNKNKRMTAHVNNP